MNSIPVHPSYELADVLVEQYNSYAMFMEEFHELDTETVLAFLQEVFNDEDLKFLIEDDYGRGLILGTIHTLFALRVSNEAIEKAEDEEV